MGNMVRKMKNRLTFRSLELESQLCQFLAVSAWQVVCPLWAWVSLSVRWREYNQCREFVEGLSERVYVNAPGIGKCPLNC